MRKLIMGLSCWRTHGRLELTLIVKKTLEFYKVVKFRLYIRYLFYLVSIVFM